MGSLLAVGVCSSLMVMVTIPSLTHTAVSVTFVLLFVLLMFLWASCDVLLSVYTCTRFLSVKRRKKSVDLLNLTLTRLTSVSTTLLVAVASPLHCQTLTQSSWN